MDQDIERGIRERAYEIWEEEGRPDGREAQHWQQAAAEFADAQRESAKTAENAKAPAKKAPAKKPAARKAPAKTADKAKPAARKPRAKKTPPS